MAPATYASNVLRTHLQGRAQLLNAELAATVVAGGSSAEQAVARGRLEARKAMPATMATEAAGYFARADRLAEKDLVDMPVAEQKRALAQDTANAAAPAPDLSTPRLRILLILSPPEIRDRSRLIGADCRGAGPAAQAVCAPAHREARSLTGS